jgi:uncharacterized phage infection (PIP) family protein YhgE
MDEKIIEQINENKRRMELVKYHVRHLVSSSNNIQKQISEYKQNLKNSNYNATDLEPLINLYKQLSESERRLEIINYYLTYLEKSADNLIKQIKANV